VAGNQKSSCGVFDLGLLFDSVSLPQNELRRRLARPLLAAFFAISALSSAIPSLSRNYSTYFCWTSGLYNHPEYPLASSFNLGKVYVLDEVPFFTCPSLILCYLVFIKFEDFKYAVAALDRDPHFRALSDTVL